MATRNQQVLKFMRQQGSAGGLGAAMGKPGNGYTQAPTPLSGGSGWAQPPATPPFNPVVAPLNPQPVNAPPPAPQPLNPAPGRSVGASVAGAPGTYSNPLMDLVKRQNQTGFDNLAFDIAEDTGLGMSEFGYTGQDTNGDGIPDTGFQVDPNNPFSRARLLQRQYEQARSGNTNSMAAQGQLYSGALQRQQDDLSFRNEQATDANLKAFQAFIRDQRRRRRDGALGLERANTGVDFDALTAALAGGN